MQDSSGAPMVRLRLEPVFDDACSKLHIDNVVARMICTYSGPATELGLEAVAPESAERIPTGAPVLLKGKRWPDEKQPSLRHRSPPISGTDQARLVVVLEGCLQAESIRNMIPSIQAATRNLNDECTLKYSALAALDPKVQSDRHRRFERGAHSLRIGRVRFCQHCAAAYPGRS